MGTALKAVMSKVARRNRSRAAGDNAEPPATAVMSDHDVDELERRAMAVMFTEAPEMIDKARDEFAWLTGDRDAISIDISVSDPTQGFFGENKAVFQRVVFAPRGGLAVLALAMNTLCDRLDPPRTLAECVPLELEYAAARGQIDVTRSSRGCCAGRVVRSNGRANKASAK